MTEQYLIEVRKPMFHLAERNLLLDVFEKRTKNVWLAPCEVSLVLSELLVGRKITTPIFGMALQNSEGAENLPRRLIRSYRIRLYEGKLILRVQVRREAELSEEEKGFAKNLVADIAEVLKLFANGDCFMKTGVEKLVAKIATEIGSEDPTAWVREYLTPPPYMERPLVRRYYRLYKGLNHAHPQCLLRRKAEELVEDQYKRKADLS